MRRRRARPSGSTAPARRAPCSIRGDSRSRLVLLATGVVLNDMMLLFDPRPGRANSIAAGKWQATPVAPTLLLERGGLRAVIGTPGGRRIPTAIAQVIVNLIDRG